MNAVSPVNFVLVALGVLGVVGAMYVGTDLRLIDPFASPVLPAEDTFNHMALVQEHVRDGSLDPLYPGGRLYPPGMHAWVAGVWAFTGYDLYQIMRFSPMLFGAIGILGMGLLLWRSEGPVAAVLGAVAYAIMPEVIRRTTMMAPTALDLALMPFFFYSMIRLIQGQLGHAGVSAPIALFFVFTHPWLMSILGGTALVFGLAAFFLPWPRSRGPPISAFGAGLAIAILGVTWALSLTGCGGACGPGFDDVTQQGPRIDALAPLIAGVCLIVAAFLALAPAGVDRFLARQPSARPISWIPRVIVSGLFLATLYFVTQPAVGHMPPDVDLPVKIGWGVLIAAIIGLALVPISPSPVGYMGLGVCAVTYPFVIYNPFDSPFWSHRTMVYLAFGLAILAGIAASALCRIIVWAILRIPARMPALRIARPVFAVLAVLLLVLGTTSQVYAATPDPPGWYRLYNPCEQDAMYNISGQAAQNPKMVIITGSWQAKLLLAAITPDANRVWFKGDFFTSAPERDKIQEWGPPMTVVIERHLYTVTPGADTTFLNDTSWTKTGEWCQDIPGRTITSYERQEVIR